MRVFVRHACLTIAALLARAWIDTIAQLQDLSADELGHVASYESAWALADAPDFAPQDTRDRLARELERARHDFGGRGPALGRAFLGRVQAMPGNTAYFFLFRA